MVGGGLSNMRTLCPIVPETAGNPYLSLPVYPLSTWSDRVGDVPDERLDNEQRRRRQQQQERGKANGRPNFAHLHSKTGVFPFDSVFDPARSVATTASLDEAFIVHLNNTGDDELLTIHCTARVRVKSIRYGVGLFQTYLCARVVR